MTTNSAILIGLSLALWLGMFVVISIKSPVMGMIAAVPGAAGAALAANWIMTHLGQVFFAIGIGSAVVAIISALVYAKRHESVRQAVAGYNRGDNIRRDFIMKDGNTTTVQYYSGYINPADVASTSYNPAEDWTW